MPFVTFMVAIAASVWAGGWRPAAMVAVDGLLDLSLLAFGLTLLVLLVGGALAYMNLRRVAHNEAAEEHTLEVERDLDLLLRRLTEAETGQRGYLLAENARYLEPYE